MQFVFKRDEEGRERICVGGVCVAQNAVGVTAYESVYVADGVDRKALDDAIERADEAGFWARRQQWSADLPFHDECGPWINNTITVDVPVADNAVLSVTVGGDES